MEEAYNFIDNNNIEINPNNLSNSFSLENFSKNEVLEVYKKIKLIRESELKIALERKRWIYCLPTMAVLKTVNSTVKAP